MKLRSIRLRLPLTYAGIALLAALALGAVLLSTLRGYYAGLERRHLQANAQEIASTMAQLLAAGVPDFAINDQVKSWSFFLEARLQLKDRSGRLLANSGLPAAPRLLTVSNPPGADVLYKSAPASLGLVSSADLTETVGLPPWQMYILPPGGKISGTVVISRQKCTQPSGAGAQDCKTLIMQIPSRSAPSAPDFTLPFTGMVTSTLAISSGVQTLNQAIGVAMPLTRSLYGFSLAASASDPLARSHQIVEQPVLDAAGHPLGTILLSSGPAYGSEILGSVARGWLVSSLAAVLLAGLVGWWVSRDLTTPLLALAAATGRMAAGDLSARASLKSDDEIGDLGRSFNEMAGRVEATVHTLRDFVGDAAHQLHTPLTALNTYLELARDEPAANQKTAYLTAAGDQVTRLKTVIDGLLELSRLEDSPPVHTLFDLREIAGELAEIFASRRRAVRSKVQL